MYSWLFEKPLNGSSRRDIHMLNGPRCSIFCNILPRGDSPEVNIGKMELEDTFNMCFVIPDCCRTRFSAVAMTQQYCTVQYFSIALHMLHVVSGGATPGHGRSFDLVKMANDLLLTW